MKKIKKMQTWVPSLWSFNGNQNNIYVNPVIEDPNLNDSQTPKAPIHNIEIDESWDYPFRNKKIFDESLDWVNILKTLTDLKAFVSSLVEHNDDHEQIIKSHKDI